MPTKDPAQSDWQALFAAAGEFISTKCWEYVDSDLIFGVRVPRGKTGYCGVLGHYGDTYGFSVHFDPRAYLRMLESSGDDLDLPYSLNGMVMYLSPKAELDPDDQRLIAQAGFTPKGRGRWPQFRSLRPGFYPWYLDRDEAAFMTTCLTQALEVARLVAQKPNLLLPDRQGRILVREAVMHDKRLIWRDLRESLTPPGEMETPMPPPADQLRLRRLTNAHPKRSGQWEIDYFFCPAPVQERPDERPYFPYSLLVVDGETGIILGQRLVGHGEAWTGLADTLLDTMLKLGTVPRRVLAKRREVRGVLAPLAQELGFALDLVEKLRRLEPARSELEIYIRTKGFDSRRKCPTASEDDMQ